MNTQLVVKNKLNSTGLANYIQLRINYEVVTKWTESRLNALHLGIGFQDLLTVKVVFMWV
eukprot:gene14-24_t